MSYPLSDNRMFVCDAYDAGFNVELANLIPTGNDIKNDLLLTRKNSHYDQIDKTSIFSINGLVYPSVVRDNGIYLINANNAQDNNISIIRTNLLCNIDKIRLSLDDIVNISDIDTTHTEPIYIKTNFDLTKHFYMLVIAGFLFVNDRRITLSDINLLKIRHLSLDLNKRYIYNLKNTNTSNSDIDVSIKNSKTIKRSEFYKFDNIKKIFTLNNSFIIKFDNQLNCKDYSLTSHSLPGKYMTNKPLDNLIITGSQKILNYKITGNKYYQSLSGIDLQDSLPRSRTTDNDQWLLSDSTPAYKREYDSAFVYEVTKKI